MIINRIYEHQNLLSLQLVSFLVGLRTYQHPYNFLVGFFAKYSNFTFHENPSDVTELVPCVQTGLATQNITHFPVLDAGGNIYSHCTVKSSAYLSCSTVPIHRFLLYQATIMTRLIKVTQDYKKTTYYVCICLILLLLLLQMPAAPSSVYFLLNDLTKSDKDAVRRRGSLLSALI